ncbi:hypothetical protein PTTG_27492 [Puccinia triticina 1-1 BBBD Race 1]|uniref:Uncharacterized protein n=1 Tax=Puccinia triticina (isolate 1-1 / race 1 (BBBD)) TaxID=630390 RepID=A0A180GM24_PUCT1|nr:hypothetical protein PTTG_27492 [Puccinia triticina 1-1 BBBD Race 1]
MNLPQDSDNENAKMKKKVRGPALTQHDAIEWYFEPPVYGEGEDQSYSIDANGVLNYTKGGKILAQTLANLPVTVKDKEAAKLKAAPASKFLLGGLFDNRSLNQLLVMWIIQSALPWTRIQDFLLGVAFNYARQGIRIYSHTWAATKAHRLYISLQEKVLNTLRKLT